MNYDITEKAMLASLNISCWCAQKHDKRVSKEVDEKYNGKDAGRFNKLLASKEAMKDIQTAVSEARTFHMEQTLPWGERGERLLPSKNYSHYSRQMRIYKEKFDDAVRAFVVNFHTTIFEARQTLGGLFDRADYPDSNEIREKFAFRSVISPVPVGEDFRVNLARDEVAAIQKDLQVRLEASHAAATQDVWKRLYDVVAHMVERLSDPEAVFRDSMVGNIVKMAELLPRLNVNDDPQLEAMRRKVEQTLCGYTPEELRKNKQIRKQAATEAKDVLKTMAGYAEAA
jgi:hypothetical protein